MAKVLSLADEVDPVASEDYRMANARLIAAAPDLLEALRNITKAYAGLLVIKHKEPIESPIFVNAMNAIAKAEGSQP